MQEQPTVWAGGWDSRGDGLTYRPFLAPGLCHIYIDNMWMNSEGLWPNVWECEQVLFNDIDIVMKLILWPLKVDIESYLNIFIIVDIKLEQLHAYSHTSVLFSLNLDFKWFDNWNMNN